LPLRMTEARAVRGDEGRRAVGQWRRRFDLFRFAR
jgi:hypothetical protein